MTQTAAPPTVPPYVNRIIKALLRSPLHRMLSGNTMLMGFTGRKTGTPYVVVVRYVRGDGLITCYTDSKWWINLRGGAPVRMRIAGKEVSGTATPVTDPALVAQHLAEFLNATPGDSKYYGVRRDADGRPDPDDVIAAGAYTTMIQIVPRA